MILQQSAIMTCTVYRVPCIVYRVPSTVYCAPCIVHCVPCTNTPCTSDLATKCYYDVRAPCAQIEKRWGAVIAQQQTLSAPHAVSRNCRDSRDVVRAIVAKGSRANIKVFSPRLKRVWGGSTDYWTLLHNNRHCPPRAIVAILSAARNCCDSVSRNC